MSLIDLFSRRKSTDAKLSAKLSGGEQPTAIDYVEWLLKYMLRTSHTELIVDTSRALPGSDQAEKEDPPPCIPEAQAVVNRLKLLSNVTPVRQTSVVTGSFERLRTHHAIVVTTQFQDSAEKSICTIRLRVRLQNA